MNILGEERKMEYKISTLIPEEQLKSRIAELGA